MSQNSLQAAGEARARRVRRIRSRISGTTERPRLAVTRSTKHIHAQLIDDSTGQSLGEVTSSSKEFKAGGHVTKTNASTKVGEQIAALAKAKGIVSVVFDRRGYPYHGRVKAVADGARKGGLEF